MKDLTDKKFDETVYKVLQDYEIPDIDAKLRSGELRLLFTTINNLFAYRAWNRNTISTFLAKQAISSKNLDTFIKSQITHLNAVMDICDFRYTDKRSYFRLSGIRFALHVFLLKKEALLDTLHNISFEYWTNPILYKNPFELIRNSFLPIIDIASFFDDYDSAFSGFKDDFAKTFLNMQTFFYAFNITEKRIKTSFSIQVYQELCNLSLSKYKTKEITDMIMHHLDIDATINLRKIDHVQCIGKMDIHKIYGYDPPLIPVKFLDTELVQSIQMKRKQEALDTNNRELAELMDEIMEHFSVVSSML